LSRFSVLIPARLASTRLPDKPLADLGGKPMVVRVAEAAERSGATQVVVATDSPRVLSACAEHGVQALLTRTDHLSGSDRLAEACALLGLDGEDIVVNLQGDEPLIAPGLIAACADLLDRRPDCVAATAAHALASEAEFLSPHVVKVVLDAQQRALYFSRAAIPCWREAVLTSASPLPPAANPALRHIGLYAYRAGYLRSFPGLSPAPLEVLESLEQLRVLWHGGRMAVHIAASAPPAGVDTPEDLARVQALYKG
jgi:3-deoxy-manno-octulosonate cytidylyltransferase (CMP-KDO synthetase)